MFHYGLLINNYFTYLLMKKQLKKRTNYYKSSLQRSIKKKRVNNYLILIAVYFSLINHDHLNRCIFSNFHTFQNHELTKLLVKTGMKC